MKLGKTYLKTNQLHLSSSCQLRQTSVPAQEQKKQTEPCTLSSLLQPVNRAFKHTKHRRSTLVVIFFFFPRELEIKSFFSNSHNKIFIKHILPEFKQVFITEDYYP